MTDLRPGWKLEEWNSCELTDDPVAVHGPFDVAQHRTELLGDEVVLGQHDVNDHGLPQEHHLQVLMPSKLQTGAARGAASLTTTFTLSSSMATYTILCPA